VIADRGIADSDWGIDDRTIAGSRHVLPWRAPVGHALAEIRVALEELEKSFHMCADPSRRVCAERRLLALAGGHARTSY
jgi:hypothetical protein